MPNEPKYIRKYGVSISMLNEFEQCPAKYEGKRILKKGPPFVESESMKWGNEVHKALEDHVKTGEVLPRYLAHMVPIIDGLRNAGFKLYAETPMAVNSKWEPCDWWDRDCLTRLKVDLFTLNHDTLEAYVIDYKTGKRYIPKGGVHDDSQLNLYGVVALTGLKLNKVTSWYMWLKSKETDKVVVDHSNAQMLRNQFTARIGALDDAYRTGNFPIKPSKLCTYCPFLETCDGGVEYRKRARFIRGNRET